VELRQFIKHFRFEDADRGSLVIGPKVRVNPLTNRAQLQENADGTYPTDANLYIKSHLATPQAVRRWAGFEAFVAHKKVYGALKTSAGFRLSNGTSEYWWNGTTWAVSASKWNTEAEVAAHISAFPTTARKLRVVVNLKSDDSTVTPELVEARVLYGALLDNELEDVVLRSLVPSLRASLRPVTQLTLTMPATASTIDLTEYKLEGGYEVVDVDAVFNDTDDAAHNSDLYLSHTTNPDGTVGVVTLSSPITAGKVVFLRLKYRPVVAITTSRDYYEVEKLPILVIEEVAFVDATEVQDDDYVGNRSTAAARVLSGPLQGDIRCSMVGMADKLVDAMRLHAEVLRYFGSNHLILSTGLDEWYSLWLEDKYEYRGEANSEDVHTWRISFRIQHFRQWTRAAADGNLVKRFTTTGNMVFTVEE